MSERTETPEESRNAGYELRDAKVAPLVLCAVALFVLLGGSMLGARAFFRGLDSGRDGSHPHPMAAARQFPPEPSLQVRPADELAEHRRRGRELLETHAWLDREHGVVRIPIERAMRLVVERGLPHRDEKGAGR